MTYNVFGGTLNLAQLTAMSLMVPFFATQCIMDIECKIAKCRRRAQAIVVHNAVGQFDVVGQTGPE